MNPRALDADDLAIKSVAEAGFKVIASPGIVIPNTSTITDPGSVERFRAID